MKYLIQLAVITIFISSCGRPKDAVLVTLQPTDADTINYVYSSSQISSMGSSKHGANIERELNIRLKNLFKPLSPGDILHVAYFDGISIYQNMPGSGINSFNTDFPDSIEGNSAAMLLQNFKKLIGKNATASYSEFGMRKNDNQKALFDDVGSSEVTDFILNHPLVFNLKDGYFWKDKTWKEKGVFKEAGINFNTKTTFEVLSVNDNSIVIKSTSSAEPAKENRPFELTAKAKLNAQYYLNRKTGLLDSCNWQENFDILAIKGSTNIPIINNRNSSLKKVN